MQKNLKKRKLRPAVKRRRRRRLMVLIFVMLLVLCGFIVMGASLDLPYEKIDLSSLAQVSYSGFSGDGTATVEMDEDAVDKLLASVKKEHDDSFFNKNDVEDSDYAKFRQSLSFSLPRTMGLTNGEIVNVVATCDEELAKKLKIEITGRKAELTVSGLQEVTKLSLDDVFSDLAVTFSGVSPAVTVSLRNTSSQPLVQQMIFEIVDAKEFYTEGETVTIHASYTEEACRQTGFVVDTPEEECLREYTVTSEGAYLTSASQLPSELIREAVEAGKTAFTDANEYGVRIFCEANLVPVYVNKKATFVYGTPSYVSSYFKTIFPEKAGQVGMAYNDLDIIYEVRISQADGTSCVAYGAVRFSDIIQNSDGTFSYDFSSPTVLSESYYSARVKKNVVDSYANSYEIERVSP